MTPTSIAIPIIADELSDIEILDSYIIAHSYKSRNIDYKFIWHMIHYIVAFILAFLYVSGFVDYKNHRDIYSLFSIYLSCFIIYITFRYYLICIMKFIAGIIILMHILIIIHIYKK